MTVGSIQRCFENEKRGRDGHQSSNNDLADKSIECSRNTSQPGTCYAAASRGGDIHSPAGEPSQYSRQGQKDRRPQNPTLKFAARLKVETTLLPQCDSCEQ